MTLSEIITLRITSRCIHDCKYCYGPKNIPALGLLELKKIFKLCHDKGVKAFCLTGGEPLLHNDIVSIFRELKKYNFKIFLDTNGDDFFKFEKQITNCVDVLGLPLDYPSAEKSYRNAENFRNVVNILKYYKNKKGPIIRVGTVVTKENLNNLKNIAELLKKFRIDIWKIYQFIPIGINATANQKDLNISFSQFRKAVESVRPYFRYFKISVSRRNQRKNAYFMIDPDGTVIMPTDNFWKCWHIPIGSIFEPDIVKKWQALFSFRNYAKNVKATYNK